MKKIRYWWQESRREQPPAVAVPPAPPVPPVPPSLPKPRRGSRENVKLSPNVIEFDMLESESCKLFGNLVGGLQAAGTSFEIYQDYNLIWVSLP
jgi:hypothetical protein